MSASALQSASGPVHPVLQRSVEECRRVVRTRAANFHWGLRLMPQPRRDVLYAVYAWMRLGDDIVDDPLLPLAQRRERFEAFALTTQALLHGHSPAQDGCWPAFAWALRSAPIRPVWILDMMEGLRSDLDHQPFKTLEQLHRYAYQVGGTVGLTCTSVWGVREPPLLMDALGLANQRGRAFQIINITRDIAQDAREGRRYIPRELLTRHALREPQFMAWQDPPRCAQVVRDLAAEARGLLDASRQLESMIDPACGGVCWAMSRIYEGILVQLEREPRRAVLGPRARLGTISKAMIAWRAMKGAPGLGGPSASE